MRQLVQVQNPETNEMEWCEVATGQVVQKAAAAQPQRPAFVAVQISELLFQAEPALHEKLMLGKPLTWREIAIAADCILCGVSQESLRTMLGARSMRDIKRAIETMLAAQRLCNVLSPRLNASSPVGINEARNATGAMRALLTLPGQR